MINTSLKPWFSENVPKNHLSSSKELAANELLVPSPIILTQDVWETPLVPTFLGWAIQAILIQEVHSCSEMWEHSRRSSHRLAI